MAKLKELREQRATVYQQIDELRQATDGREMSSEEQTRWDTLMDDHDKVDRQITQAEQFLQVELRQAAEAQERAATNQSGNNAEAHATGVSNEEYRTAFVDYILRGSDGISHENRAIIEKRAGLTGLAGGVIIPTNLASQLEIALKSYGGMFEAASIISTAGGGDLILPTINDTSRKAAIVAEYQQSTKDKPTFGSATLKAYTYRTPIVPVSIELLQDSAFELESLLAGLLADSFGRGINEHLTTGDGTGKPTGVVTSAINANVGATATALSFDNVMDLIKSVDNHYARNGKLMFNKDTLFALMKIKDTTGRYIWQDSIRDGSPATICGKTYIVNDDIAGIGAGKASVLFGDFSKYKIRMVKSFRTIRLNELLAEYLSIGIFGFARADGMLLDAGTNPIKKLVHAAT